jgi:hypothetical protein
MDIREAKKAIESYISSNIVEYPVYYDNIEISDNINELFIDVGIKFMNTNFLSIGDTSQRRVTGMLIFDVYDLANTGSGNITGLCQTLVDLFTAANIGGIRFKAGSFAANGMIGKWYSMSVFHSFYFDVGA